MSMQTIPGSGAQTQLKQEVIVKERETKKLKRPPKYDIILHDPGLDELALLAIAAVLINIFGYDEDKVLPTIGEMRDNGKVIVATFSKEVAEAKVQESREFFNENGVGHVRIEAKPQSEDQ